MMTRRTRRQLWRWGVAGGAVLLAAAALVGWLSFQHVPAWYQPPVVPAARLQEVKDDLARTSDSLNEQMATATEPFELVVTQEQVNAWLTAREDIWPLSREWLPDFLTQPFIAFEEGGLRVGGTCEFHGVRTVIGARIEAAADGKRITVRLAGATGGSLPIPQSWLADRLADLDRRHGLGSADLMWPSGVAPRWSDLLKGVSLPNSGVWPNPKRAYHVIGLRFEPQKLVVTFRPLPYGTSLEFRR